MNTTPKLVAISTPIIPSAPGKRPSFQAGEELKIRGMEFIVSHVQESGIVASLVLPKGINPHMKTGFAENALLHSRFLPLDLVQIKGYWFKVAEKGINGEYITLLYFGRSSKRPGDSSPSSRHLKRSRRARKG